MKAIALDALEKILAIAKRNGASEVRLISGQRPVMVVATQVQYSTEPELYFGQVELTASMIRDIHLECLTMARGEVPASGSTLAYRMVSEVFGPLRCEYTLLGGARTLSLIPDGDETGNVLIGSNRHPPPLRDAAEVDPTHSDNTGENSKPL